MYKRVIYWFRRDLRIEDNEAFFEACNSSFEVIPVFIFIPSMLERFKSYDKKTGFLISCLKYLSEKIEKKGGKLYCFNDEPEKVLQNLIRKYKIQAIFTNKAFSWSGEEVEERLKKLCLGEGINFIAFKDNFLAELEKIPYKKIYSSFYRHWRKNLKLSPRPTPEKIRIPLLNEPDIDKIASEIKHEENNVWKPDFGFERLKNFDFSKYEKTRDRLDIDGTSKLSPYIRFGVISLRKIYKVALRAAGDDCQFIKEMAWREFWYHIKLNFPQFKTLEFQEKRRKIQWQNDEKLYKAFNEAKTGYPLIDAAIIQLKQENWMHNRARMMVASFLTKDLSIDWRFGESFFMEYLIDYDEVVNAGNWQWNASVGPDPKPLRVFNPIIQAKKFDPDCKFIKKYLPSLKKLPNFMLHDPLTHKLPYHKPIVNHLERLIFIRKLYS